MIGTMNCVYETPCGWCSKWDKKCDKKSPDVVINDKANVACKSDFDHEWEWVSSLSTGGTTYICKNCGKRKTVTN